MTPLRITWWMVCVLFCSQINAQTIHQLLIYPTLASPISYTSSFKDSSQVRPELDRLLAQLKHDGYYFASVDSLHWAKGDLHAYLYTGDRFQYALLETDGDHHPIKLDLSAISAYQKQLLTETMNEGFPFASSFIDSAYIVGKILHLRLKTIKRGTYLFDTIRIESKDQLPERVIRSATGIKPNSIFQQSLVDELDEKIGQLPFVKITQAAQLKSVGNKAQLNLSLEKKQANRFDGYIGLVPNLNKQSASPQLIGELNLMLIDLLHQGETLSLVWKHPSLQSQKMQLNFSFPYLFSSPFALKTNLGIDKRDSTNLNLNTRFEIDYHTDWTHSVGVFADFRKSVVLLANAQTSVSNSSMLLYGFNLKWKWVYRASSLDLNSSLAGGQRSSVSVASTSLDAKLDGSLEQRLYGRIYAKLSVLTEWMFSEKAYADNEMIRIGGLHSLRGFAEESIPVSGFVIPSLELKYKLPDLSAFYFFYDWASFIKKGLESTSQGKAIGLGIGLELGTKSGVFSLVYAIGQSGSDPLKMMDGVIHIGFANRF